MSDIGQHFLAAAVAGLRDPKQLGDRALAQIDDQELFATGHPDER